MLVLIIRIQSYQRWQIQFYSISFYNSINSCNIIWTMSAFKLWFPLLTIIYISIIHWLVYEWYFCSALTYWLNIINFIQRYKLIWVENNPNQYNNNNKSPKQLNRNSQSRSSSRRGCDASYHIKTWTHRRWNRRNKRSLQPIRHRGNRKSGSQGVEGCHVEFRIWFQEPNHLQHDCWFREWGVWEFKIQILELRLTLISF